MDAKSRALCLFYRNPPNGAKKLTYTEIAEIFRNEDGEHPTGGAVRQCVLKFHEPKAKRGRKSGYRKKSKVEDKLVLQTFRRLRPPRPRGRLAERPRESAEKVARQAQP